jgi:hypothetical protein
MLDPALPAAMRYIISGERGEQLFPISYPLSPIP